MQKIKELYYYNRVKVRMYISFIIILLIFAIIYVCYIKNDKKNSSSIEIVEEVTEEEIVNTDIIYIDIKGEVEKPNVYEVKNGSRVIDVINLAGGLKENANTRFINLAKVLSDGDVIVIYSNSEIDKAKEPDVIYVDVPCVCEEVKNDACLENSLEKETESLININTCTIDDLKTLDGIGDVKAKSIIEYREVHGGFNKIEDILNVSGISEKIYENIKDKIKVS